MFRGQMKRTLFVLLGCALLMAGLLCTPPGAYSFDGSRLDGRWKLVPGQSASIDPWSDLILDIRVDGSHATIVKRFSAGSPLDRRVDSMTVNLRGEEEIVSVPSGRWLGEVSMGIYYGPHTKRQVKARMSESRGALQIDSRETVQTAQGSVEVDVREIFTPSPDGSTIQWHVTRSTRLSGPPLAYTFSRVTQ